MKATIKEIDAIVEEFEFNVRSIDTSDKKEYQKQFDSQKEVLQSNLKNLQLIDPLFVPYSMGNDAGALLRSIADAAEERKDLRWAYAGGNTYQMIQKVCVDMPLYYDLQHGFNVLVKEFDSGDHDRTDDEHAEKVLNTYLLYVLLSYPRGKVRINFIDPYFSGKADTFINQLCNQGDESMCRLLQDDNEINDCLGTEMKRRMSDVSRMGDRYFIDHTRLELFVLLDYPRSYDNITDNMELLIEKGQRSGIQFVVLHDTNQRHGFKNDRAFDVLSMADYFTELDTEVSKPTGIPSVHFATDLFEDVAMVELCFNYLRNGLEEDGSADEEHEGFTPLIEPSSELTPVQYFDDLEQRVSQNVTIPFLTYYTYAPSSRRKYDVIKNRLPWMANGNSKKNFVIQYTTPSKDHAEDILNQLVMKAMLSLPITKVHVSIVNPEGLFLGTFLNKNIEDRLVAEINNNHQAEIFYANLLDKMRQDRDELGCSIERYNEENRIIVRPYEIIVLLSPETINRTEVFNLFDNGSNSGIYFIVLADKEKQQSKTGSDSIIHHVSGYQSIDADADFYPDVDSAAICKANIFSRDRLWMPVATKYINDRSVVTIKHDWGAAIRAPYAEFSPNMSVTIGYEASGAPFEYKIGITNDHYHGFVIGGTGSGKSRFLHNIILGLSLKYRPEDLELHILDLKGPEFGRYRSLKHARSILVEQADVQITYEVLSEIERKIDERKVLFEKYKATDLKQYEEIGKGPHLPQILLIVDECQELFVRKEEDGSTLTTRIINIIKLIATQGRSWGVHMLLGTQSLNNAPLLDEGILTQIQDHFILPCVDSDAKQLVSNEHKERVGQEASRLLREKESNPGQCFYQGAVDGYKNFKFNHVKKGEMEESLLQACIDKAATCRSNGQGFFSGRQHFSLFDNWEKLVTREDAIIASPGQTITLNQSPQLISLIREPGQNILTIGYDDKQFVTRTSIDLLVSLMLSSRRSGKYYRFAIINCLGIEAKMQSHLLKELETAGYCELIDPKHSGSYLRELCDDIAKGMPEPTVLTILRQESYVQLKNNAALPSDEIIRDSSYGLSEDDCAGAISAINDIFSSESDEEEAADVKTYRDALAYILNNGPEHGVHTLMQINKSSEFCVSAGYNSQYKENIEKIFGHIVLLQTDKDTESFFSLHALSLWNLSESEDRLRAYYYNPNGGSSQLLSPYMLPSLEEIKSNI